MTRSNRILNRVLIALVGLVAIAVGLAAELPLYGARFGWRLPTVSSASTAALWTVLGGCVAVVVLALVWIVSRGRGRTAQLIVLGDPAGSITIDARVAGDLLSAALRGTHGVASVGCGTYAVRGRRVLSIRVVAARGSDIPELVASVQRATTDLDAVLETRMPVLLQVLS